MGTRWWGWGSSRSFNPPPASANERGFPLYLRHNYTQDEVGSDTSCLINNSAQLRAARAAHGGQERGAPAPGGFGASGFRGAEVATDVAKDGKREPNANI